MINWKENIPINMTAFFPQLCATNCSKTLWISINLNMGQWCFNILARCHQAGWSMVYRNQSKTEGHGESISIPVYVLLFHLCAMLLLLLAFFWCLLAVSIIPSFLFLFLSVFLPLTLSRRAAYTNTHMHWHCLTESHEDSKGHGPKVYIPKQKKDSGKEWWFK